ncbi:MAG TPA: hypothetical protein DCZ92_11685 [Elusimicrobia bacterium]|nr:MAG: hypothetical protein A2016_03065 [Elusimicrobia bacterium GWF2_62_30]HBA61452.1 hypothetical protein [Elusimicrobiota bacterium]
MSFPKILGLFSAIALACMLPRLVSAQEMPAEMVKAASAEVAPELDESPDKSDTPAAQQEMKKEEPAPQKEVKKKEPPAASLPGFKAESPASVMAVEWEFLKANSESKDDDVAAAVLPQLSEWLKAYPESEYSEEAMLLKANLQLRLGDYRAAVVTLIRHTQEYPGSTLNEAALQQLNITIDKKLNKKVKGPLNDIAKAPASGDKAAALAAFVGRLADQFGEEFYAPVLEEFSAFSVRFPAYPGRDALQLSLGNLYARKGEYMLARLSYEKLIQVYPSSKYLVRAKRALGDVLANNLKDYLTAIKVYHDITVNFPGTDEAWAAYLQLPRLTEKQKQYARAVDVYEKIIALYPDTPEARDAYKSAARVLREDIKNPAKAVEVLNRLADKYKDEKVIDELYLAAEIARKDLRDIEIEVKMYDRITAEYPDTEDAPKALMAAGQSLEKVKDLEKAKEYYQKIIDTYPEDSLAKKARKYITALTPQQGT